MIIMNDRGSITGDGLMIHDAGDVSQRGSGCRSTTSSPFVTLNCPNNEVSNLQECEVMEVEGCDCTVGTNSYATVTCLKCKTYFLLNYTCMLITEILTILTLTWKLALLER